MTEKLISDALKASFMRAIADFAEMPFAETGVAMPSDKVWDRYARDVAAALSTPPQEAGEAETPPPPSHMAGIIEAARDVIASASDSYKKRNGHLATFEDDSGEKCWIVPFDAFEGLRSALAATEGSAE